MAGVRGRALVERDGSVALDIEFIGVGVDVTSGVIVKPRGKHSDYSISVRKRKAEAGAHCSSTLHSSSGARQQ